MPITWTTARRKRAPRDGQKSKLYEAERKALNMFSRNDFGSAVECEIFIGRVLRSERAKTAALAAGNAFESTTGKAVWPVRIRVRAMRANARGAHTTRFLGEIAVAATAMTKAVMLHELAHHITPKDVGHGAQFAAVYLALVNAVLGRASGTALKAAFKVGKVRFKPKRSLSPERRAAAVARLAAYRASQPKSLGDAFQMVVKTNARLEGESDAAILKAASANVFHAPYGRAYDIARTLSEF